MDIVVHDVDLLRYLLAREPLSVQALVQNHGMAAKGLDDSCMSLFEFEDQILAQVHVSFVAKYAETRLFVLGTEGNISAQGSLSQSGAAKVWLTDANGSQEIAVKQRNLYVPTVQAFVDACAAKGQVLASGEDGLRSMAAALATLQAAHHERKMDLPKAT
jgi:1,5-anhydro-D-fructose reductase (1,5-anhydro-D-mannitol-forming)